MAWLVPSPSAEGEGEGEVAPTSTRWISTTERVTAEPGTLTLALSIPMERGLAGRPSCCGEDSASNVGLPIVQSMGREKDLADHARFFVPATAIKGNVVTLSGAVVHQIKNVLRLRPGDHVTLLDNSGWRYDVEITALDHDQLAGAVHSKNLVTTEPRTKVTLYQGLLRGQQFEFVLQKATEVGVSVIVPTICQRCVVANLGDATVRKLARWERIVGSDGLSLGIDRFGASAPYQRLAAEFGFTPEAVSDRLLEWLRGR